MTLAVRGTLNTISLHSVIHCFRKELILKLVAEVQASSPVPIDYSLLHEGGCTCDDTELPHHISSNRQIAELVDCVQDVVSHLKKPTIVTVAR